MAEEIRFRNAIRRRWDDKDPKIKKSAFVDLVEWAECFMRVEKCEFKELTIKEESGYLKIEVKCLKKQKEQKPES